MSAFVSRCRAAASPLQLSVYWRLALVLFFVAFYFFTDIYMTAIIASTCHHGNDTSNGTLLPIVESNQSRPEDGKAKRTADDPVCVWTELLPYGQTSFMVGMLLGSLVGGTISDRYGKRPTLLVSVYLCTVSGLVPALLPQPIVFLVIRCLLGVVSSCIISCSFSLAVEWTPASARLWPPAFLPCCFSMGMMVSALLAWLSPTVRWLHLSLGLPQVVCLPLYISIPESPSWLLVKQRKQVLERYGGNSTEDKHHLDQLLDSARSDMQKAESHRDHTLSNLALFRHPTILLRLLVMSYISTVTALTYYGICLNIDLFGVNVYAAQFFSGLTEIPCLLVPLIRLGRRPIATLTLFLSGASCFLSLLLSRWNAPPTLVMSLALLGKLCMLASVFIFILYGIELFPTVVRQRCLSIVNLCFRVGTLINYLFNSNGQLSLAAMVTYSSGPIIGCGLCLLLPETSRSPLPDSVEDCDKQPLLAIGCGVCRKSNRSRKTKIPTVEKDHTHTHRTHSVDVTNI